MTRHLDDPQAAPPGSDDGEGFLPPPAPHAPEGEPGSALRQLVARVFGFDREIIALREQIKELSWDTAYGMWTRGAFLQFCQIMPRGTRTVVFLDLDRIHVLNERLGYSSVDRRISASFGGLFRRSDVVARWYSGDEIVILFDADRDVAERKVEHLALSARAHGLTFQYAVGDWEVGKEPIEDVVEALATRVAELKAAARK
ncbi:MAG: hypothetical protein ABIL09_05370 [Gemmatimonadota bacterium]